MGRFLLSVWDATHVRERPHVGRRLRDMDVATVWMTV